MNQEIQKYIKIIAKDKSEQLATSALIIDNGILKFWDCNILISIDVSKIATIEIYEE